MRRRSFLAAASAAAVPPVPAAPNVKRGVDLFSLRSQGWTPFEYLAYCAKLNAKVVHFSEIRFLGGLDPSHLRRVRARAEELGIETEIGMRSICPTSKLFDPSQGTAEQQLERMIEAAATIGSPIVRAFLGSMADRTGSIPIERHIENTVKVLRSVKSRTESKGIKIAIENHAGDMQGRELKMLIEEAGKDFTGACIDSGNPLWTIEDPHVTLDHLHPYVLTSHVRDSAVWRVPEGAAVQWVRMGEGNVKIDEYVRKYLALCPGKALSLELIVTQPRIFAFAKPEFWDGYRRMPAWEFARFLQLADEGTPRQPTPAADKDAAAAREREDLEASARYMEWLLGAAA